jgi:hypothetical protein
MLSVFEFEWDEIARKTVDEPYIPVLEVYPLRR